MSLDRSPQRQKMLGFLEAEQAFGRPFPAVSAIRKFMGWKNDASVTACLQTLNQLDRRLSIRRTVHSGGRVTLIYLLRQG